MTEHHCREHLPKPRRRLLGRVRACPCGRLYACRMQGILAPGPRWLAVMSDDLLATCCDRQHGHLTDTESETS